MDAMLKDRSSVHAGKEFDAKASVSTLDELSKLDAIFEAQQESLDLSKPFVMMPNGLAVKGQPSQTEWLEAGRMFLRLRDSIHWLIGDWLNYGMEHYNLTYEQAEDFLRRNGWTFQYQSLRIDKYVASRVPLLFRHNKLSWQHHKEVASLEPERQTRWLSIAEEQGISTKELRAAIKGAENLTWLCYTDLWDFSKCDKRFGVEHPSRIPGQIIQNILYYYTRPNAFVIDPMDRYGTTADVCNKCNELRREYCTFDKAPNRDDIMKSDPTGPWPTNKKADLVLINPSYINTTASSCSMEEFESLVAKVVTKAIYNLKPDGILSIFVAPRFMNQMNKDYSCEIYNNLKGHKSLKYVKRIIAALPNNQMSRKAIIESNHGSCLVSRISDLLIFKKQNESEHIESAENGQRFISKCAFCGIRIGDDYLETQPLHLSGKVICSQCLVLMERKGSLRRSCC